MHLEPIKELKEIALEGISLSFNTEGSVLTGVVLSDGKNTYAVKNVNTYSNVIQVFKVLPYRTVKAYVVSGDLQGFNVSKTFKNNHDAESFIAKTIGGEVLTIAEREVPEISESSTKPFDEVPF